MATTPRCPNPECRAPINGVSSIDQTYLRRFQNTKLYAVCCVRCGVTISIVATPDQ